MHRFLLVGLVLPLLAAPAFSQSTPAPLATHPGTVNPVAPRTDQSTPATPTPMPGMTATPAPVDAPGTTTAPIPRETTTDPGTRTGLAPGANSFTESQARARLLDRGYTFVSELKRGQDGVWRGTATMDAKSVAVSVDYKGDISGS